MGLAVLTLHAHEADVASLGGDLEFKHPSSRSLNFRILNTLLHSFLISKLLGYLDPDPLRMLVACPAQNPHLMLICVDKPFLV